MTDEATTSAKSRDDIARAYSSEPWWYDVRGFLILTFAYRSTLPAQVRFFGNNIGLRHLEVAIGSGTLLDIVLKWRKWRKLPSAYIVGIDYAESMVAGARQRFLGNTDVALLHADAAAIPCAVDSFDSVNIANAVHCFPYVDGAFREVLRVLKPGGVCAANVLLQPRGPRPFRYIASHINDWGMRKGILVCPYDEKVIHEKLLAAGFEVVSEDIEGNTLNVIAIKPKAIPHS